MAGNQAPGRSRLRRLIDRMSLRTRLVLALFGVAAVVLVSCGVLANSTLNHYLLSRTDSQLLAGARAITGQPVDSDDNGQQPPNDHDSWLPPPHDDQHGLPSQFAVEYVDSSGNAVSGPASALLSGQSLPAFPKLTAAQISARAGKPFTINSVKGSVQWRVVALRDPSGDGGVLVAESLSDVDSTIAHLQLLELLIGLAALLILGILASVVVRVSLRPLRDIEATAESIAGGDLSRRVPERNTSTELGRLGASINGMLSRIESAFRSQEKSERQARASEETMRRFVADASHELRTPLTSIRGFAELYRQGGLTDDADARRAMSRIEAEATRMGVLVEDLLLLAKLDEQRPLVREPVDLVAVCTDVVADARATAPQRSISVDSPSDDIATAGDPARLHQVVANLVSNAVRYTPGDTDITVRLGKADENKVFLEVVDHGPGLTPEQQTKVFERFYRTDDARDRLSGGSGLGLSIVAALVAAHGGTVRVLTTPGGGATFRVELPAEPAATLSPARA